MNKLIIVRHGESVGNANNIIQGKNNNYGLTNEGRNAILLKVQENLKIFKQAKRILVSPYKRTIETAIIISNEIRLPVLINDNIEEMDAGILSGMDKDVAKRKYTEYYEIWKNREDLDIIPYAESGENLQARVIGFLMQYYDKSDFCDIIVSHAGFIRCLVNTIENRVRTYKFSIENGSFFQIDGLFKKISIEKRDRAMNSKVYVISVTNGKYVVKLKKGMIKPQDEAEKNLLDSLSDMNVPRILSMQNYSDDTYCKVIRFVEGEHKYGKLTDEEYCALIDSEEKLKDRLKSEKSQKFEVSNLRDNLENIYSKAKNTYIKALAKTLLSSKYVYLIEDVDSYTLSHNDLNRDNILFEKSKTGKIKANFIDFEALEYAPVDFQFASMLASSLLIEGEDINKIERTIVEKGKELGKILFFMQIRLLEGLNFFANRNEYSENNRIISLDLLKRYFFASVKLQREVKRIEINTRKDEER